jgi:hypothetical protein
VRLLLIVPLVLVLAAAGCGDDDEDAGGGGSSNALKEAVAKTEAAKTARMDVTIEVSGQANQTFRGDVLVDFENDRNLLTMSVEGQTIQMFSDGPEEYVRVGTSGRYQQLPESEQTPVANNPTDSLKYLSTDVVGVSEGDEAGCYEGELDFARIFERVESGRESEFPEQLRRERAPVLICLDDAGRIRRYDVEMSIGGVTVDMKTTTSDYGSSPTLEPLGPDELPG